MPKFKNPHLAWSFLIGFCSIATVSPLYGQQADIPPATQVDDTNTQRIVEGRPRLYRVKRALHPVAWVETGLRPLFRTIEGINIPGTSGEEKAPPVSGIKLGIRGLGASSGIGPEIKPFHNDVFGKGIEVEMPIMVTYKLYHSAGVRTNFPLVRGEDEDRLGIELAGRYTSRAADRFYGVGNDSDFSSEARFRSVSRTAAVAVEARMGGNTWIARIESGFRSVGVTRPRDFRSVTEVFPTSTVPGLTEPGATMIVSAASLERNTTDQRHLPASGGVQRVEASLNEGRTGGDFSYWRYRGELQQFLPLTDDKRKVIALRAHVETNQPKGGSIVPFWDLPIIGSRSTVRGFHSRRFTDRSSVSASAEYRFRIWRHFDWGLFADTGQVAPEIRDFAWNRLHTAYGMRFMVRAGDKGAVSIDVAKSPESWMFYLDFSPNF